MSAWLDLHGDIVADFVEAATIWRRHRTRSWDAAYEAERARKRDYMRDLAPRVKRARMLARLKRASERPPCPHCGAPVERVGTSAKLPKYCSPKCMRAARWARWWERNKDTRNAARKAA